MMNSNMEEMAAGATATVQHMTGTRMGHIVPATFFAIFGTFFLALTFKRLQQVSSTREFCQRHIPESNRSLLRQVSVCGIGASLAGLLAEWLGDAVLVRHAGIPNFFWVSPGHQALYALFLFAGVCGYLESLRWVPRDTLRMALVLSFSGHYLLMNQHAAMKKDMSDQTVHQLWAYTCLLAAVSFAASVYDPTSILPFVASFASVLWQGLWVLTAAYNWSHRMEGELVMCLFLLEGLMIATILLVATSYFHRKWDTGGSGDDDEHGNESGSKACYQPIQRTIHSNAVAAHDDDDDNTSDESSEDSEHERLNFV